MAAAAPPTALPPNPLKAALRDGRRQIGLWSGLCSNVVAEVLALMEEHLKPGISTAELDRIAERHIRGAGGIPSFLNYLGGRRYDARDPHAYPASTCISIDDETVLQTLGVVLKHQSDQLRAAAELRLN